MPICDEMWNNVTVYGPQAEIDRFKQLCIVPAPPGNLDGSTLAIDFDRIYPSSAGVEGDVTWNFRDSKQKKRGVYEFKFDTAYCFPWNDMEQLAAVFPSLHFSCECIADDDSYMGYGWFNTPAGGDDFDDGYDVPEDHWESSHGYKRPPMEQAKHQALIDKLERAVRHDAHIVRRLELLDE